MCHGVNLTPRPVPLDHPTCLGVLLRLGLVTFVSLIYSNLIGSNEVSSTLKGSKLPIPLPPMSPSGLTTQDGPSNPQLFSLQPNRTPQRRQSRNLPLSKPRKELVRSRLRRGRGRSYGDEPREDGVGVAPWGKTAIAASSAGELWGGYAVPQPVVVQTNDKEDSGGQGQASQPMDERTTARPYSRPTDVSQPWETE